MDKTSNHKILILNHVYKYVRNCKTLSWKRSYHLHSWGTRGGERQNWKGKKKVGKKNPSLAPLPLNYCSLFLLPFIGIHLEGALSLHQIHFFPWCNTSMCSQLAFIITFAHNFCSLRSIPLSFWNSLFLLISMTPPSFLSSFSHSFAVSNHIIFSIKCSNPGVFKPL